MRIQQVHVQRFRSIYDATLECDELTVLVGANGAGKSSFLRALEVFYNPNAKIDLYDFYNCDQREPIVIRVTYCKLSQEEQQAFHCYYHDGSLSVKKRIEVTTEGKTTQQYYGQMQGNPDFTQIRNQPRARDKRNQYDELRQQDKYKSIPGATSAAKVDEALAQWEAANPDECELLWSEHQFFGFKEVSTAKLETYTRFLLVPAVRDASADGEDTRGSVISQLVDMVVRSTLAENQQVCQIKSDVEEKLRKIPNLISLDSLNSELNTTMQRFAPNTAIALSWKDMSFQFQDPQVDVQLKEDGYISHIHRSGHGVQRAFIMTMLQHLAMGHQLPKVQPQNGLVPLSKEQTASVHEEPQQDAHEEQAQQEPPELAPQMNLILAVEEPELFQHPSRQRHFSAILHELASGKTPGVAKQTQVLYCTHSPFFVNIDNFPQIRLIYKTDVVEPNLPKQSTVKMVSTERSQEISRSHAKFARLLTTEVNEGFFATMVVLVEGESDRALLNSVAQFCRKISLAAHGIAIIPVDGNKSIAKPLVIFKEFGIRTYPVWDNDRDKDGKLDKDDKPACTASRKINREILNLCGCTEEDWPEGVHDTHAVFSPKLEEVIKKDVQNAHIDWQKLEDLVYDNIGDRNLKRHAVVTHVVQQAYERGCQFPTVVQIIDRILTISRVQPTTITIAMKSEEETRP